MDVIYAMKKYITEMIDQAGPGMKVLLMDDETVSSVQGKNNKFNPSFN